MSEQRRKTSKHGRLTSESTIIWMLNVDCVKHPRTLTTTWIKIKIFDGNIDRNLNFLSGKKAMRVAEYHFDRKKTSRKSLDLAAQKS